MATDFTGRTFGFLVVLDGDLNAGTKGAGKAYWRCLCTCGSTVSIHGRLLGRDYFRSCGSDRCREAFRRTLWENRDTAPGTRFRKLVVLEEINSQKILCQCDCGNLHSPSRGSLIHKTVQSCGCLNKEVSKERRLSNPRTEPRMMFGRISKLVKIRDDFVCALCKVRSGQLNVHHIASWKYSPELRFEPKNMVTLCRSCHVLKAHKGGLQKLPDPEVAEFLAKHVRSLPLGGELEKHGTLALTPEEIAAIVSGVVPDRIKRNWEDTPLPELLEIATHNDITKELQR